MNRWVFKPVLVAGFSFLAATVLAQDYIDVEAEREAARRARQSAAPTSTAPSEPEANQPAIYPAATPDVQTGSPAEPVYGGIRPYSGTTRLVTPADVTPATGIGVTAGDSVGDLVIKLQQLEADVRRLNGLVEEQAAALRRLEEQSLERYVDIDRRLAGGATAIDATGADVSPLSTDASTGTIATTGQTPVQPDEEATYRAAYELVRNRQFAPAVEAFQDFLVSYPFGRYAPNAHYWLGELYLVVQPPDPELARQSFKLLLDQYPDNAKVPDALFKLGKVHFLKGNRDRSREYLDRVITRYGDEGHPAAQLAQDFISKNF